MFRLGLLAALCLPVSAWAGGTTLVQQGRLLDVGGTSFEGDHDVTFTVYSELAAAWSETDTISFAGGYYATVLGNDNPTLHDLDFANGSYTLGITVGTGVEMSPRTPLTSVVSALLRGEPLSTMWAWVPAAMKRPATAVWEACTASTVTRLAMDWW